MESTAQTQRGDDGFVMVAILVILTPLMLLVGSFSSAMDGRGKRLEAEMSNERALFMAEAGIDVAVYYAHAGVLTDGLLYTHSGLGGSSDSYSVQVVHLLTDGEDNDNLNGVDDPNEDVYQIQSAGTADKRTRTLVAYLGPQSSDGAVPSEAAMTVFNPAINIDMKGTPLFNGNNFNIDGTLPGIDNKYGLAIADDGTGTTTTASIDAELTGSERANVIGTAGAPSLTVSYGFSAADFSDLVADISNTADVVLTNSKYTSHDIGDAGTGDFKTMYRTGDLTIKGNCDWAGVLVVDGDLNVGGTFRFDGIILVTGNMNFGAGTVMVNGGIIMGPASTDLTVKGTLDVRYSQEAWDLATANLGPVQYVLWNGWQELAR